MKFFRAPLALTLVLVLISSPLQSTKAQLISDEEIQVDSAEVITLSSFSDVESSYSYFDSIKYVRNKQIVNGYPDGTYKPEDPINRAEFAKIIMNAITVNNVSDDNDYCFPDVRGEWFADFVCLAEEREIVNGYTDGTFGPSNNITLGEAAKIITLAFGYEVSAGEGSDWATPFVSKLDQLGALPPTNTQALNPLTRGEMAYIIEKIMLETGFDQVFTKVSELGDFSTNYIDYSQALLLASKYSFDFDLGYGIRPNNSNFDVDLSGGFDSYFPNDEIDLLTGQRAIDESLQTGSIGNWNTDRWGDPFEGETTTQISAIEELNIPSHSYEEMITAENITVNTPAIANLAPADNFFVHFSYPDRLAELDTALANIYQNTNFFYSVTNTEEIKRLIFERLGIPSSTNIYDLVSEIAFVSEDLDFFKRTDFALIVKFDGTVNSLMSNIASTGENKFGTVGNYYVLATSESLFNKIATTYQSGDKLSDEGDFRYATGVLTKERHGLVYFSDKFIRKLTSPEYRLNSRRKNTVLEGLKTLQYSVFAYRGIEGKWPSSFEKMASEGYINLDSIYQPSKYSISSDGNVTHTDWGSLIEPTPVNRVAISEVTQGEVDIYNRFRSEYQQLFQQFFDPIGVAIQVDSEITFHTIILPLIDESSYNLIKAFFGSTASGDISLITSPDREAALALGAKFSMDEVLYAFGELLDNWSRRGWSSTADEVTQAEKIEDFQEFTFFIREEFAESSNSYPAGILDLYQQVVHNFDYAYDLHDLMEIYVDEQTFISEDSYDYYFYQSWNNGQCFLTAVAIEDTEKMQNDNGFYADLYELGDFVSEECQATFTANPKITPRDPKSEQEKRIRYINSLEVFFKSLMDLPESERVFDFVGDEIIFGIGADNRFLEEPSESFDEDFSELDMFFGVKITDREKAERLTKQFFASLSKIDQDMTFTNEEVSYNGQTYHLLSNQNLTEYLNIKPAYIILDDRLYFGLTEKAIKSVIDGTATTQSKLTANQEQILSNLGSTNHYLGLVETASFLDWFSELGNLEDAFRYELRSHFRNQRDYLNEYLALEKITANADKFYHHAPEQYINLDYQLDNNQAYLNTSQGLVEINKIVTDYYYYYDRELANDEIEFATLLESVNFEVALTNLISSIKAAGVGSEFTEHGLDIKLSIDNPVN
jgi:hypothetical protein